MNLFLSSRLPILIGRKGALLVIYNLSSGLDVVDVFFLWAYYITVGYAKENQTWYNSAVMTRKQSPQIVSAAVIEKDGLVLIGKRKRGKHFAGNWEFPGGTLEEGETPEQCLKRELQEELAIEVEVGDLFCSSAVSYTSEWTVKLLAYRTTLISGVFNLSDHEEIRWVKPADLVNYDFPEADKSVVEKLMSEDRHRKEIAGLRG